MPNTYTLIASNTVGSGGSATVTFSSIAATYTDLLVKASVRATNTSVGIVLSFNGSTASRTTIGLFGDGTSTVSYSGTDPLGGLENSSGATANTFGNSELYVPNYAGSTYKSSSMDGVVENNGTAAQQFFNANLWSNTAAITSITFTPEAGNFAQYSSFYLYGISKT
jgi:hypothetical protein